MKLQNKIFKQLIQLFEIFVVSWCWIQTFDQGLQSSGSLQSKYTGQGSRIFATTFRRENTKKDINCGQCWGRIGRSMNFFKYFLQGNNLLSAAINLHMILTIHWWKFKKSGFVNIIFSTWCRKSLYKTLFAKLKLKFLLELLNDIFFHSYGLVKRRPQIKLSLQNFNAENEY